MTHVLFVCTGNIFRSLTAEYALRRALGPESPLRIGSAGTEDFPYVVQPVVRDYLLTRGLDVRQHLRRTLTEALMLEATTVVAMNHDHQNFIRERFGRRTPLFMEACGQGPVALPDVDDVIPDHLNNRVAAAAHVQWTIDRIIELTPSLVSRLL